jgi:addiction module HigA family antidote
MVLSQYRLAKEIGMSAQRISKIVSGRRSITADTDLRLCRFLGLSKGYWLRAEAACDTKISEGTLDPTLKKIKPGRDLRHNQAPQPDPAPLTADLQP